MKKYLITFLYLFLIGISSISGQNNSSDFHQYYEEGLKGYLEGNFQKAFDNFNKGYQSGDKILCGQFLGELYYSGLGCKQDSQKAFKYFKESADLGNPEAQYAVGIAYVLGEGCEQNLYKAREYYKKAADKGIPEASYNYGAMLFSGEGGPQDLEESLQYYMKASDAGFPDAQYCVALVYYYGDYKGMRLKQDKQKAYVLFKKSADQGLVKSAKAIDQLF